MRLRGQMHEQKLKRKLKRIKSRMPSQNSKEDKAPDSKHKKPSIVLKKRYSCSKWTPAELSDLVLDIKYHKKDAEDAPTPSVCIRRGVHKRTWSHIQSQIFLAKHRVEMFTTRKGRAWPRHSLRIDLHGPGRCVTSSGRYLQHLAAVVNMTLCK